MSEKARLYQKLREVKAALRDVHHLVGMKCARFHGDEFDSCSTRDFSCGDISALLIYKNCCSLLFDIEQSFEGDSYER